MTTLDRRTFLARAGLTGAAAAMAMGLPRPAAAADETLAPFEHGVASGDPTHDRVLLWTRVTPPVGHDGSPIEVTWRVHTDVELSGTPVATGSFATDAERDWTVKVDATGLSPFTYHYYVFEALGSTSLVGRTKTAPARGQAGVDRLRVGVTSCSNYTGGFFNVYARMAERNDLDLVLHLGDYLYEYGNDGDRYGPSSLQGERDHEPAVEMVTLADYRARHALYKRDPDLRRLHQLFPFVCTWDDHETTDNSYATGANNHNPGAPQSNPAEAGLAWEERLADASRVYAEWMPVRVEDPKSELYRGVEYGDLMDVVVMDTRIEGRAEQASDGLLDQLQDPERRMISQDQLDFVLGELRASQSRGTAWRLLAQQVMMMQFSVSNPPDLGSHDTPLFIETPDGSINSDAWDGYPAERARLWDGVLGRDGGQEITDMVVLTGDIHTSWAADLHSDPGNPATYDREGLGLPTASRNIGVEFVTPSVTSANFEGLPGIPALETAIMAANPHIKFTDLTAHGYNVLDVTAERVQSDWFAVDTVVEVSDVEAPLASWYVEHGTERVVAGTPLAARDAGPAMPVAASATSGVSAASVPASPVSGPAATVGTVRAAGTLAATGGGTAVAGLAAIMAATAVRRRSTAG